MKLRHFAELAPICPVCQQHQRDDSHLVLGTVIKGDEATVTEGILLCPNPDCQREYPIIDGIPLIIPQIRAWIETNIFQMTAREDLSATTESLLTDCCGSGSAFEVPRQHISSYAWDHYAEFDPEEANGVHRPGQIVRLLDRCLEVAGSLHSGPILDLGCGVGRTSFALAERTSELVVGIDLHYAMLRVAARILSTGIVKYPRRRTGIVYDRREFAVQFPNSSNVDFWGCDANALPFRDHTFGTSVSMNMLDCVNSPMDYLHSVTRVTASGGKVLLTCPYDWSIAATPIESWLGGHSQRSGLRGASDTLLRAMLTPGDPIYSFPSLRLSGEADNLEWQVRLHDRSIMKYLTHLIVAEVEHEVK